MCFEGRLESKVVKMREGAEAGRAAFARLRPVLFSRRDSLVVRP